MEKLKEKKREKLKIPYERRKAMYGYGFISLWLIGTINFFIIPLFESFKYSFKNVNPEAGGMEGNWVGLQNYIDVFGKDPYFRPYLIEALIDIVSKVPLILIFSLFIAVILNQKFKGRVFARAVFFLPVIIATGPVYAIITGNLNTSGNDSASQFSTMFQTDFVTELLEFTGIYGLNEKLTENIKLVMDNIFGLVWNAGIQILIFLAGLQNIPSTAREAAQIEGATAWEYFWKITFPYVTPMIIANLIFALIDSFTDPTNKVMTRVLAMQYEWVYGKAAAMVWSYFIIVLVVVGVILAIVNKFVYYEVD